MGQIFDACVYDTEDRICSVLDADKFHANCYSYSGAVAVAHYLLRQKAYHVMWCGGYKEKTLSRGSRRRGRVNGCGLAVGLRALRLFKRLCKEDFPNVLSMAFWLQIFMDFEKLAVFYRINGQVNVPRLTKCVSRRKIFACLHGTPKIHNLPLLHHN
jgi:hypothetical protein